MTHLEVGKSEQHKVLDDNHINKETDEESRIKRKCKWSEKRIKEEDNGGEEERD